PEVAAVSAIKGVLTDPREFDIKFTNLDVNEFLIDDSMIIKPADVGSDVEVVRGPNIKPFPLNTELSQSIGGKVILKTEDNITT
ncbi:aconitate hydratase, partial [Clostridioides difficile]|nr:aconitate hydratase [Clostridioides difficile]NJB05667.1 aconitate hydratase [Clostridioides difficile]